MKKQKQLYTKYPVIKANGKVVHVTKMIMPTMNLALISLSQLVCHTKHAYKTIIPLAITMRAKISAKIVYTTALVQEDELAFMTLSN